MALTHEVTRQAVTGQRLQGIQYLRAIAALMVAYFHATIQLPSYTEDIGRVFGGHWRLGSGVDLFFVISGFIMLVSSQRTAPADFLARRLIRIVPLYWALTVVVAILIAWHPESFHHASVSAAQLAKSLLFIPYANPGQDGQIVPLLVPGWSLNFEMFFYLLFAVALTAPLRYRTWVTGAVFVIVYAVCGTMSRVSGAAGWTFFANARLFEFLLGVAIAQYSLRGRLRLGPRASWTLIGLGFSAIVFGIPGLGPGMPDAIYVLLDNALPAAAIVSGAVALEQHGVLPHSPGLQRLGDASYSMYLSHLFALGAARVLWTHLGLSAPTPARIALFLAFSLVLVVATALATYRVIELPLQRWGLARYRERALRFPPVGDRARDS